MKCTFFFSCFLLCTVLSFKKGFSQSQKDKQDIALFAYNVGFGGISSGLGAMINKKNNEKALPTFWRGFKYGCLGGTLNYCSKRIDFLISESGKNDRSNSKNDAALLWAWPTKIVHSAGSSIMANAAANKPNVFQDYNFPIGFVNLAIHINKTVSVTPQLMPFSFGSFVLILSNPINHLQLKQSLLLGTPYFTIFDNTNISERDFLAVARTTNVSVYQDFDNSTFAGPFRAHEYIHVLQYNEYEVFNSYLIKPYEHISNNHIKKVLKKVDKYIYPDIPYRDIFYSLKPHYKNESENDFYKNLFELEAEHFGTNSYVKP